MRPAALVSACVAAAAISTMARGGHELPVYPSYYPHEIALQAVPADAAADLLRQGRIQAYVGTGLRLPDPPPVPLRAVESLGGIVVAAPKPGSRPDGAGCGAIVAAGRELAAAGGFVFHPYPVTPFHGDYLYHADRVEAAKAQTAGAASASGDVQIETVDAAGLIATSATASNGWLGPPWLRTGWFHAERLLADVIDDPETRQRADALAERLKAGDYRDAAERINLERDLVGLLSAGCRRLVVGYTVKRQYFSAEFTDGVENIGFDAVAGLESPIFLRTVKLKNFPWNGWLALGVEGRPAAAWNPMGGFTDRFGRLLWSAVGDPALIPDPYGAGWMLNRISNVEENAAR
jgi:hypothetical protein